MQKAEKTFFENFGIPDDPFYTANNPITGVNILVTLAIMNARRMTIMPDTQPAYPIPSNQCCPKHHIARHQPRVINQPRGKNGGWNYS